MRARALFFGLFLFTTPLFAIDRWILISGTVSNFHTDARLFNPAFDKDIQVTATFYATTGGTPLTATITVPKRQMKILNDVTTQLFSTSSLGAILFTSSDPFEVTSRIYALTAVGTLGQFGPGTAPGLAKNKGALLQLQSSSSFRTNVGVVNPNNATANVTWTLYDKNSAIVSSKTTAFTAFQALAPTNVAGGFFADPQSADLSDAWLSFSSDQPILAYASVIDNGTTDQTFIPAVDDVGVPPANPSAKTFDITERSFSITVSPTVSGLKVGDVVTFHIRVVEGPHSFELIGPNGNAIIPVLSADPGGQPVDRTFTITDEGTYSYHCTNTLCGSGHLSMTGTFTVGKGSTGPPGY
jgi:plastocyanin